MIFYIQTRYTCACVRLFSRTYAPSSYKGDVTRRRVLKVTSSQYSRHENARVDENGDDNDAAARGKCKCNKYGGPVAVSIISARERCWMRPELRATTVRARDAAENSGTRENTRREWSAHFHRTQPHPAISMGTHRCSCERGWHSRVQSEFRVGDAKVQGHLRRIKSPTLWTRRRLNHVRLEVCN